MDREGAPGVNHDRTRRVMLSAILGALHLFLFFNDEMNDSAVSLAQGNMHSDLGCWSRLIALALIINGNIEPVSQRSTADCMKKRAESIFLTRKVLNNML